MRAGIAGYGLSGRTFHLPLLRAAGIGVNKVAVREPRAADAESGITFVSFEDLCRDADIDLIVVSTPNELHREQAVAALRAGKHVVVEKPLATRLSDARAIAKAAEVADRVATVFHSRRLDGDFLTVRQMLEESLVGDWCVFESRWSMNKPVAQNRWKDRADAGGGLLIDFLPHLVDQALQLFGAPDSLQLETATQRAGASAPDFLLATLRYGDRRVILWVDCFAFGSGQRFRLAGSAGEYVCDGIDPQEGKLRAGKSPLDAGFGLDESRRSMLSTAKDSSKSIRLQEGAYLRFYEDLRVSLASGRRPTVKLEEAIEVVAVIEALQRNFSVVP